MNYTTKWRTKHCAWCGRKIEFNRTYHNDCFEAKMRANGFRKNKNR